MSCLHIIFSYKLKQNTCIYLEDIRHLREFLHDRSSFDPSVSLKIRSRLPKLNMHFAAFVSSFDTILSEYAQFFMSWLKFSSWFTYSDLENKAKVIKLICLLDMS